MFGDGADRRTTGDAIGCGSRRRRDWHDGGERSPRAIRNGGWTDRILRFDCQSRSHSERLRCSNHWRDRVIDLRIDREPLAHIQRGSPFHPVAENRMWLPISSAGIGIPEPIANLEQKVSKHWLAGSDLLQSIEGDREPICSGAEAATTVEMISAVSVSHLANGARIELPLKSRTNLWGDVSDSNK